MKKLDGRGLLAVLLMVPVLCLSACGVNITQISIPTDCDLSKGDSAALEVTYTPEQETTDEALAEAAAKLPLTWTSANEAVAAVDETGTVTAVGAGTTEITAAVADTGLLSTCAVTVTVPLEELTAPDTLALAINGTGSAALNVSPVPADATDVKLTYTSSDPNVAAVDEHGMVTAAGNGECVVTARAGSCSTETKVTVTTQAEEIQLKTTEGILTVGDDFTITATLLPETVSQPGLTWKSSDEAIATVDENGKMAAKAKGTATITVSSADGAASADYTLTVNAVKCSYCGKEGHASTNCPQKAADQKAAQQKAAQQQAAQQAAATQAAQQAAQQQAAAQAAEQAAAAQAAQQAAEQAAQQAAEQQAQQQASQSSGGEDSSRSIDDIFGDPNRPMEEGNYVVPGQCFGDWAEAEGPPAP